MCVFSEWDSHGWSVAMEEQFGQTFLRCGGLYDLFQCHPQLPLLPAQNDLPDLQEEISLCLLGEPTFN